MNQFQAPANQGGMFSPSANNPHSSTDSSDGSPKEHAADSKSGLTRLADFWKRYDRLADNHDRKMSQNLNGNLDVLLIFAALFSAINTAFIGLTMSTLSPDPLNRTNKLLELLVMHADNKTLTSSDLSPPFSPGMPSIVTNCFLYASLCCSLLAAMGAMLGKEWLQSFDRSGQTGPTEEQGRFRQSKFNGVQQWHLETIILFLPNLLLFSVTLFFTGLAIFLFSIEKAVSVIVIAFEGFAVVMWSSTTIAGALQPLCPYQTAASRALRRLLHFAKAFWKYVRRVDLHAFGVAVSRIPRGIILRLRKYQLRRTSKAQNPASAIPPKGQPANLHLLDKYRRHEDHDQHRASAQAACWLLETASNREDQLAAVYFMRTLDLAGCSSMVQDFEHWRYILLRTQVAFDLWQYQPTEKHREEAEIYGRGVCHILLQCPETDGKWRVMNDMKYRRTGSLGRNFLEGFKSASEYLTAGDADEFAMQVALLHALAVTADKPIDAYRWSNLKKLVTEMYPDSDILISLSAVLMYKGFGVFCDKSEPIQEDFDRIEWRDRARDAYKREQLGKNLVLALASTVHAIKPVTGSQWRPEMVEICTIYIRMARNLTESAGTGSSYVEWLGKSVAELMVQVDQSKVWDPLDAHWAEFTVEAVLTLQALNSKNLRQLINSSPAPILPGLWRAFDIITIALKSTNGPIQGLGPNFILDALEWLSSSLSDDDPMSGLEGDHATLRYIASGLSDKAPRRRQRWLQLFLHNRRRWFEQASKLLCRRWLDAGLGGHLLEVFERPMTWGKSETGIVDILESTLRGPSNFGLYLLGSAPFITACAGVIAYLDEMRESSYNNWRGLLRRVLEILLVLWRCTSDMPGLGVNLAPETMVPALRGATGLLNWELTHEEARQKPRYADELCNFIMVLKRNLPISTLISRNVDVAVNSLQGQLPTQLRASWKYHLYEVSKAPTLCSRPSYLKNGIM